MHNSCSGCSYERTKVELEPVEFNELPFMRFELDRIVRSHWPTML